MARAPIRYWMAKRKSDGAVHGTRTTSGDGPVSNDDTEFIEIDKPLYMQLHGELSHVGGGARWEVQGDRVVERKNPNRVIRIEDPDKIGSVGGASVGFRLFLLDDSGAIDESFSEAIEGFRLAGFILSVQFVKGVGFISVPTFGEFSSGLGVPRGYRVEEQKTIEIRKG